MLKVVVIGYGKMASSLMLGVLESDHELIGIYRWERVRLNNFILKLKDFFNPSAFYSLIKANKIPEIKAKSVNCQQFKNEILRLNPDVILVGSWGEKFKKEVIIFPRMGCINCHPSLLPSHRGPNPYYSTIKQGKTNTGVTFHLMDEELDSGPILLQQKIDILKNDTGGSLRTRCCAIAREMTPQLLSDLEEAKIIPKKQDESKASYFPRIDANEIMISLKQPVEEIHNKIRAMKPWNHCYIEHYNDFLRIGNSKIIELDQSDIKIKNKTYKNLKPSEPGDILLKGSDWILVSSIDEKKAILFEDLRLLGDLKKFFTSIYIKSCLKKLK